MTTWHGFYSSWFVGGKVCSPNTSIRMLSGVTLDSSVVFIVVSRSFNWFAWDRMSLRRPWLFSSSTLRHMLNNYMSDCMNNYTCIFIYWLWKPWRRHHRLPWSNVIQFHDSYWIVDSVCGLWGTKQIWCGPQLTADHQFIWRFSLQRATWMSWSISLKKYLQCFGDVLPLVNFQQWPLQGVHKSLSLGWYGAVRRYWIPFVL